jgi:hypothetical protein
MAVPRPASGASGASRSVHRKSAKAALNGDAARAARNAAHARAQAHRAHAVAMARAGPPFPVANLDGVSFEEVVLIEPRAAPPRGARRVATAAEPHPSAAQPRSAGVGKPVIGRRLNPLHERLRN